MPTILLATANPSLTRVNPRSPICTRFLPRKKLISKCGLRYCNGGNSSAPVTCNPAGIDAAKRRQKPCKSIANGSRQHEQCPCLVTGYEATILQIIEAGAQHEGLIARPLSNRRGASKRGGTVPARRQHRKDAPGSPELRRSASRPIRPPGSTPGAGPGSDSAAGVFGRLDLLEHLESSTSRAFEKALQRLGQTLTLKGVTTVTTDFCHD